ncbi:DUF4286 family protein [Novosphingobium pentaromativorans]|uniref:Ethyl tert-butyl ether degradation EthD n=1 Tax=Novosphingobium pentaromativorans US6-1 TaxID=1088721 RepID=G6EAV9_9SPHN|nr:DUF4286 family protein [Novosphingobium pentaromativorans]EHJ61746.1 hypothetical protein NSU_1507 [Novosphingobium pentaromativorans US6-1]
MARYLLLALNGPTSGEGDEETYNEWYRTTHLPDLLALDGIETAERFEVVMSNTQWPYVAAYTIETDDIDTLLQDMTDKPRPFSPTFDRSKSAFILARKLKD